MANTTNDTKYTLLLNERQRKMLHRAMLVLVEEENEGGDPQYDEDAHEEMMVLTQVLAK